MNGILFGLADVFEWVFWAYRWIVIAAIVITWVQPDPFNPIVRFLRTMTEPVFRWLRQRMPFLVVGDFDLSPIAVFLILMFLNQALVYQLRVWGRP